MAIGASISLSDSTGIAPHNVTFTPTIDMPDLIIETSNANLITEISDCSDLIEEK